MGGKDSKELVTTPSEKSNKRYSATASTDDEEATLVSYQKSPEPSYNRGHRRNKQNDISLQDNAKQTQEESNCRAPLNKRNNQACLAEETPVSQNPREPIGVAMKEEVAGLVPAIKDNLAIVAPQVSSLQTTPQLNITGNISIVHHSDNTVISNTSETGRFSERRQLSYTENLREHMESKGNWQENRGHLFVETNAYKELRNVLDDMHWVTLLGKPGDGKSSTAAHLMLEYRCKGYEPVFVTSTHDWKAIITAGRVANESDTKQIVVIDDIFGTSCLEQGRVGEWLSQIENMEKLVEERNGKLLVICTSRRYIFSDVEASLTRFKSFRKLTIVDMTDIRFKHSSEEKKKIFDAFATEHNVSNIKGGDVKDIDSPHCFPLCAEMFCVNSFLRKEGVTFFRNPVECVQKEIHNLKDNDNHKYIVLLTMLLKRNLVPRNYFEKMYDVATDDEKRFFKSLGVSLDTVCQELVRARDALISTYITTNPDGHYTFIHESLLENVAEVYLTTSPFHAVEMIEFEYVAGFLNRSLTLNETIPKNLFEPICRRVVNEIKRGNVLEMCRCDVWNSDTFVETLIEYLQSDMKAYTSEEILKTKDTVANGWDIQYKIISDMSNIHYSPVTSYELISAALYSVINTLIYCNRNRAVVSLLENDVIQFHNEESYWSESLKLGLELAGTEDNNNDVMKAIICSKVGKRLNGSRALAISLACSNAEYAEALLNGTDISPNFADTSGRSHFHYLIDSNITIDKFESIAHLLSDSHLNINETDITGEPLIFSLAERLVIRDDGFERFQVLLRVGASIDVRDTAGRNFVLYSLEKLSAKGCLKVLKSLEDTQVDFQSTDHHGANAMHYFCAQRGDSQSEELFKFLVDEKTVNISQVDNTGRIPLMLALLNACPSYCITFLLDHSPKGHIDKFGRGFFHYICGSNVQCELFNYLCDILLNRGEDVNHHDSEGISPLFECVRNIKFSVEHIKYLIARGAKVDVTDENGRNIVLYTITWRRKNADIVQFLNFLFKQTDVNFQALDNAGKNALHHLFDSDSHDENMTDYFDTACDFLTKYM